MWDVATIYFISFSILTIAFKVDSGLLFKVPLANEVETLQAAYFINFDKNDVWSIF